MGKAKGSKNKPATIRADGGKGTAPFIVTEAICALVQNYAKGSRATIPQVAALLGISRQTLLTKMAENQDLRDAYDRGIELWGYDVQNAGKELVDQRHPAMIMHYQRSKLGFVERTEVKSDVQITTFLDLAKELAAKDPDEPQ